ncbi:protein kinase [Fictibacillus enclensis]|uniref:protein kinase domain-containing protein n=1 Tax=Fictibacillus enclensis TaxID=1017270 RepID=UPI0025A0E85C|nr:protein kinase [Fictibacillus enclensis]MDM5338487.1 protein kinase [Fictibacillus enclensis]
MEKIKETEKNIVSMISDLIKQNNKSMNSSLGIISDLKQIGQGGNGLVYGGLQNNQGVAIKFLVENSRSSKLQRFKAEYFNINLLEDKKNIVNYINYEEITLEEGLLVPAIIMKRYSNSLKGFRDDSSEVDVNILIKLFYFLLDSLSQIHKHGIIHRDIKPENILVTKDCDFVLADFGIASYNPDIYALKAKTEKRERLANYEFAAPEQAEKNVEPAPSMDIYALGQVCQWYVFGKTHKGTNRANITSVVSSKEVEIIESILNKCLYNNPQERYQSIDEIHNHIEEIKEMRRKVDPFDEMNLLNDAIRETCPSITQGLQYVTEEKYIKRLINNINKRNFKRRLQFNTGRGNAHFDTLKYLGDKKILLDFRELLIKGLWLYTGSSYDDLIILETEEIPPFVIKGKENYYALIVNNEHIVESHHLNSGYIEIEDEVYRLEDLEIEEHNRANDYKFYFLGTDFHCSILAKNDIHLDLFQDLEEVNKEAVFKLIREIRRNKHKEVFYRL